MQVRTTGHWGFQFQALEGSLEGESTAAAQEQVLRQIQEEKLEGNDSKLQLDWTLVHHNVLMLVH